jgi:hypothetical protein
MDRARAGRLVALAILAFGAVLLLGSTTPAWAHPRPVPVLDASPGPIDAPAAADAALVGGAQPSGASPLALTLVLASALAAAFVQPRRTLVVVVAALLGVLAVESGVHSVHHLGDHEAAEGCAIASVSGQIHGAEQPGAPDGACIVSVSTLASVPDVDRPGRRPLRPDEGRAPPAA